MAVFLSSCILSSEIS